MAIAHVQSVGVYGTGPNVSVAFGSNVTAGNAVIVGLLGAANSTHPTATTVSSSPANTFSRDATVFTAGKSDCNIYSAPNVAGGATTVSTASIAGGASSMAIYEVSGLDTTSIKDVSSTGTGTSGTHSPGTTAATSVADEFIFMADSHFGATSTVTQSAGYTLGINNTDATNCPYATAYKIVAATGTQTGSFTWTSAAYDAAIVAYKGVSAGGGPTILLLNQIPNTLVRM